MTLTNEQSEFIKKFHEVATEATKDVMTEINIPKAEEKTKDDFIKWAEEQIEHYKPILGLELSEIEVKYIEDCENYMDCSYHYPYFDNTVRMNKKAFEDWKSGELKRDRILHEICHIITDPFYGKALERFASKSEIEDERERLTDYIRLIIKKLDK